MDVESNHGSQSVHSNPALTELLRISASLSEHSAEFSRCSTSSELLSDEDYGASWFQEESKDGVELHHPLHQSTILDFQSLPQENASIPYKNSYIVRSRPTSIEKMGYGSEQRSSAVMHVIPTTSTISPVCPEGAVWVQPLLSPIAVTRVPTPREILKYHDSMIETTEYRPEQSTVIYSPVSPPQYEESEWIYPNAPNEIGMMSMSPEYEPSEDGGKSKGEKVQMSAKMNEKARPETFQPKKMSLSPNAKPFIPNADCITRKLI